MHEVGSAITQIPTRSEPSAHSQSMTERNSARPIATLRRRDPGHNSQLTTVAAKLAAILEATDPCSASFRRLYQRLSAAALAAGLAVPTAAAQDARESVTVVLSIRDTGNCVHPEGVYAAVQRRSSRVQFTTTGEHAVELDVKPEHTPDGTGVWRANVELTRAGAIEPARTLEAADCASLVDAIGFIVALTFDPPGAAKPEPEPSPLVAPQRDARPKP